MTTNSTSKHARPSDTIETTTKRPRLTLHVRAGRSGDPPNPDLNAPSHQASIQNAAHSTSRVRQKCRRSERTMLEGLIPMDEDPVVVKEPSPTPSSVLAPSLLFEPALDGMQRSLDTLDATSHEICLRLAADERADKGTNNAYARHLRNYVSYWDQYQAEMISGDPTWTSLCLRCPSRQPRLSYFSITNVRVRRYGSLSTSLTYDGNAKGAGMECDEERR